MQFHLNLTPTCAEKSRPTARNHSLQLTRFCDANCPKLWSHRQNLRWPTEGFPEEHSCGTWKIQVHFSICLSIITVFFNSLTIAAVDNLCFSLIHKWLAYVLHCLATTRCCSWQRMKQKWLGSQASWWAVLYIHPVWPPIKGLNYRVSAANSIL